VKDGPPTLIRVQAYTMLPTSIAEMKATGRYWDKRLFATYMPPYSYDKDRTRYANLGMASHYYHHLDGIQWMHESFWI
jgi:hypothetical protein